MGFSHCHIPPSSFSLNLTGLRYCWRLRYSATVLTPLEHALAIQNGTLWLVRFLCTFQSPTLTARYPPIQGPRPDLEACVSFFFFFFPSLPSFPLHWGMLGPPRLFDQRQLADRRGQVFAQRFFNSEPLEIQVQWLRRYFLVSHTFWATAGTGTFLERDDLLQDVHTTGTGALHPDKFSSCGIAALTGTLTAPYKPVERLKQALDSYKETSKSTKEGHQPPKDGIQVTGALLLPRPSGGRKHASAQDTESLAAFEHYLEDGPLRLVVSGFGEFLLFVSALGSDGIPELDATDPLQLLDISRVMINLLSTLLRSKPTRDSLIRHLSEVLVSLDDLFLEDGTLDQLNPEAVISLRG